MNDACSPARILVVEDDEHSRRLAQIVLEGAGYGVLLAPDARSALEAIDNHTVDLVLLDLVLPDMDGADVARAIRGMPDGESIPIIAVSAHFGPLDLARVSPLEFTDCMSKPLDADLLLRSIEKLLPNRSLVGTGVGAGRRVVVADDEPVLLRLMAVRLSRIGFQVETAVNGRVALDMCLANPPDAIVADALMPVLDGFGLCLEVRKTPALSSIPVLLVTSQFAHSDDRALGHGVGANAYVVRGDDSAAVDRALLQMLEHPGEPEPILDARELSESYRDRLIRQLERQVRLNTILTDRVAHHETLLSVMAAIGESLSHVSERPLILQASLGRLISSSSFTSAAGYLISPEGEMRLVALCGQAENAGAGDFHGQLKLLQRTLAEERILKLPQPGQVDELVSMLVERFAATTLVLMPLVSEEGKALGIVALGLSSFEIGAEMHAFLRTLQLELLRAMALADAQERSLHAQKLESVGQLASGVAHDFNNLLTAIMGFTELVRESLDAADPRRSNLDEVLKGAEHGASLAGQLLAFSRKDLVAPRVFELNAEIRELSPLLKRLIGSYIVFALELAPELAWIRADPGQIQQILMNLAINARDSMPKGGTLRVSTLIMERDEASESLESRPMPGQHVVLAITDDGEGMSETTKARAFEPFFTTKGIGRGTGLGLSTVSAIVRSMGGELSIESSLGRGTSIRCMLPTVEAESRPVKLLASPKQRATGTETVLLVEDDPAVLSLLARVLEDRGYRVLAAADAAQAQVLARAERGPIHVLVTDIVMPRERGPELATRLREERPGLPILFISGYVDQPLDEIIRSHSGARFLQKPLSLKRFLGTLRELLDEVHVG